MLACWQIAWSYKHTAVDYLGCSFISYVLFCINLYCISKSVMKIGFRLFQKTNTKENFLPSLLNLNFVLVNLNNDAQRMLWPPDEFLRWVTAHLMSTWCYVHVTRFPRPSLQMFAYWNRKQRPETKASLNQLFSADLDNSIVESYTWWTLVHTHDHLEPLSIVLSCPEIAQL